MNKSALKRFATQTRLDLMGMVGTKLGYLLSLDESALPIEYRDHTANIRKIKERCTKNGSIDNETKEELIEEVAYTWFNRLIALRFMDANTITEHAVISPLPEQVLPAVYTKAKEGVIEKDLNLDKDKFFSLIDGKIASSNPDNEAYKMLFISVCNYYSSIMPFMFEAISDYTELLLPDDMLSPNSIRAVVVEAMPDEDCQDVEIIGWLYQYYISEKKEKAMAKKAKYKTTEIPAVTQLFTPDWIVKYMVENTLGRLWMLNNPASSLKTSMEYYIDNPEEETDYISIRTPEEITVLDPCCGSGHILTYAFDLLTKMYEESGYNSSDIPFLILENNLFGCDIDKRAATLAQFAMAMKARLYYRRFFKKSVKTNIIELDDFGSDEFKNIKTFGSLLKPNIANRFDDGVFGNNTPEYELQMKLLSGQFHCVITNPPYMGGSGMNPLLSDFIKIHYPDVKSDLFSAFIVRNTELTMPKGQLGFMTPFVWMFISSYEKLRAFLIDEKTITSLIQLEYSGFDGATVPICTFTVENAYKPNYKGGYVRLSDFKGADNQGPKALEIIQAANKAGK